VNPRKIGTPRRRDWRAAARIKAGGLNQMPRLARYDLIAEIVESGR
jgi:hypothetical protein